MQSATSPRINDVALGPDANADVYIMQWKAEIKSKSKTTGQNKTPDADTRIH